MCRLSTEFPVTLEESMRGRRSCAQGLSDRQPTTAFASRRTGEKADYGVGQLSPLLQGTR